MRPRRPLRVLALAAEAFGGRGGIAQSTQDLMMALRGLPGIGAIEILPRHVRVPEDAVPEGIVQHAPRPGRLAYSVQALRLAALDRPDIVYCGHAFMAPLARLAARLGGAAMISHVHGLEVWQPLSSSARRGLAGSDVILCVSRHTAGKVVETAGADPSRCAVIHNTVHERFVPGDREAARARFGLAPGARVLSTVSRLDPGQRHKGHELVIEALGRLAPERPELVYLVAGTGGDRDRLAALAETHGVADRVRFLGFTPFEDLPDLYRASDLYVMPSSGEGFGIAFVEAMCCGTPALGLALGGAPDALRDGDLGRAVQREEFAQALEKMLAASPPDRAGLALRARETFGRPRFQTRLAEALAPLTARSQISEKAFP